MSEYDFMHEVKKKLEYNNSNRVTRIESGGTQVGIPDIYATLMHRHYGQAIWIECKYDPSVSIKQRHIKVNWGPGQQVFAADVARASLKTYGGALALRCPVTFLKCKDGVIFIPMYEHYVNGIIDISNVAIRCVPSDKWSIANGESLVNALWYMTTFAFSKWTADMTVERLCKNLVAVYTKELLRIQQMPGIQSAILRRLKGYMPYDWQHVLTQEEFKYAEMSITCRCREVVMQCIEKRLE